MRAKLGGALSTRQATAAVFESKGEAMACLGGRGDGVKRATALALKGLQAV